MTIPTQAMRLSHFSRPGTAATARTIVPPMDEKYLAAGAYYEGPSGGSAANLDLGTGVQEECDTEGDDHGERVENGDGDAPGTRAASIAPSAPTPAPQVTLTFLTVSGSRRTMTFDPETPVGRVKELVWNAWPSDWEEEKPPAPNYLRLLYLGRILQDEETLVGLSLPITTEPSTAPPTIMHLSIRLYPPPAEDESMLKKKAKRQRAGAGGAQGANGEAGNESRCGCGCIIC